MLDKKYYLFTRNGSISISTGSIRLVIFTPCTSADIMAPVTRLVTSDFRRYSDRNNEGSWNTVKLILASIKILNQNV